MSEDTTTQLTPETMDDTMAAMFACWRAGVPTFLWGPPGSGKGAVTRAMASAIDAAYEPFIMGTRMAEDLGFPYDAEMEGPGGRMLKVTKRTNPVEFVRACVRAEAGKATVFLFDELNTVDEQKQGAVMTLFSDGYIGDLDISSPLIIKTVAGNPPGDGVGAQVLAPAMASRFWHGQWGRLPGSRVDKGLTEGWDSPKLPKWCSEEALQEGEKFMAHRLVSFNASTGRKWGAQKPTAGCWGWGNSRTMQWCKQALSAAHGMGLTIEQEGLIVEGLLGRGAGCEWAAYREQTNKLMDPEEALAAKLRGETVQFPGRGDLVYALVESVVAAVLNHSGGVTGERWEACFDLLFQDQDNADIAVEPAKRLMAHHPTVPGSQKRWPIPRSALNLVALLRE